MRLADILRRPCTRRGRMIPMFLLLLLARWLLLYMLRLRMFVLLKVLFRRRVIPKCARLIFVMLVLSILCLNLNYLFIMILSMPGTIDFVLVSSNIAMFCWAALFCCSWARLGWYCILVYACEAMITDSVACRRLFLSYRTVRFCAAWGGG